MISSVDKCCIATRWFKAVELSADYTIETRWRLTCLAIWPRLLSGVSMGGVNASHMSFYPMPCTKRLHKACCFLGLLRKIWQITIGLTQGWPCLSTRSLIPCHTYPILDRQGINTTVIIFGKAKLAHAACYGLFMLKVRAEESCRIFIHRYACCAYIFII